MKVDQLNWHPLRFHWESVVRLALHRIRRGSIWLAALLILIQPLVKPDCCCAILHAVDDGQANSDGASPVCCRKHKCHDHARNFPAVMPRGVSHVDCPEGHDADNAALPTPRGCDCPPTCPCHFEHAPPEAAIASTFSDGRHTSSDWIVYVPTAIVAVETQLNSVPDRAVFHTGGATTVLRCALLCRFVV